MSTLPAYTSDQLAGILALLPGVDAVELKLTVSDQDRPGVIGALGIDPLDAQVRQVAFIDTPDLRLSAAGLVVRARRTQRKSGDATVKLRPMLPEDVPEGLRELPGFKVEVDASPAGYVCSCSLTAEVSDRKVKKLYDGGRSVADVLAEPQLALLTARLPEDVTVGDLRVLGPVHLLKCKFQPGGLPRPMVAELWFLPDGSRLLELSTKAAPAEAFQAAAETKIFLAGHGVDLAAPQEAKTRTALAALTAALDKE
ncbi:hypothetical protein ASC77_24595 [Nocardioides sp. Root1257]|uniref:hypothetical protein n=1 Tax=unclassified Nocardioides TaxID=2615069 RepID=UPI0006FDBFEA|nr:MULTISPECIES: hypothetical protein [unclassified Nocardioides]KQW52553.1 hypothetical protein ASC77_24595 [Nocardioides sp. Root1257]KRC54616.1 hypothetical protein ASE24_24385 [Nocardioides sp. Root224]